MAGGLVWSLYLLTAARDRRVFVGTTVILFFITNIYKTISYVWIDIISLSALAQVIPAIPMIFIGSYLGNIVNKRCNHLLFRKIVLCFISLFPHAVRLTSPLSGHAILQRLRDKRLSVRLIM